MRRTKNGQMIVRQKFKRQVGQKRPARGGSHEGTKFIVFVSGQPFRADLVDQLFGKRRRRNQTECFNKGLARNCNPASGRNATGHGNGHGDIQYLRYLGRVFCHCSWRHRHRLGKFLGNLRRAAVGRLTTLGECDGNEQRRSNEIGYLGDDDTSPNTTSAIVAKSWYPGNF